MSKQANFVSVRVTPPAAQYSSNGCEVSPAPSKTVELLCAVRALLKKIKQQVLVGDRVHVVGVDWADKRGEAAAWCSQSLSGLVLAQPTWYCILVPTCVKPGHCSGLPVLWHRWTTSNA